MNSKAAKITPLFLILMMTLSAFACSPNALATNQSIQANHAPFIVYWVSNSASYATYNGHLSSEHGRDLSSYPYEINSRYESLVTANMTVKNGISDSNISVEVRDLFTFAPVPDVSGVWYDIDNNTGLVLSTPRPYLIGYPCFFYLPDVNSLHVGDKVNISTPFDDYPIIFTVNRSEPVLGVSTIQLVNVTINPHGSVGEWNMALWFSNTTDANGNGLLMRLKGHSYEQWVYYDSLNEHNSVDMSLEIGTTNILTLTPPPMPKGVVPWMKAGKYIQYDLQGNGYIDIQMSDKIHGKNYGLPDNTKFSMVISSNVTLKIERGTTAYIDPWGNTSYVWILHLMLNNTKMLLPDFRRTVTYLNTTFGMPTETAYQALDQLSYFNHTGLVADTWLIVENRTGMMFWPGMHGSDMLSAYDPEAGLALGEWLSKGYGLQVLSWFAQSYLYQGWKLSIPDAMKHITQTNTNPSYTETVDVTADASITDVGTEYLTFSGGGGGNCWRLETKANIQEHITTMLERSVEENKYFNPSYLIRNSTGFFTGNGFIDIERVSGFPLRFKLDLTMTLNGEARFTPYYWFTLSLGVGVNLEVKVPKTNIWFSNPPVTLSLGRTGAGDNVTTPGDYFGKYGIDAWMSGAGDVSLTSSASPPPDTGAIPESMLPFVYLDIQGVPLSGSEAVMLYLYYNVTKVHDLGIDENSLKIYVYNASSGEWDALASTHTHLNATTGVLVAILPHLSYFAVLGSPSTGGAAGGISTTLILIAAVAVIAVAAAVVVMKKRGHSKL